MENEREKKALEHHINATRINNNYRKCKYSRRLSRDLMLTNSMNGFIEIKWNDMPVLSDSDDVTDIPFANRTRSLSVSLSLSLSIRFLGISDSIFFHFFPQFDIECFIFFSLDRLFRL